MTQIIMKKNDKIFQLTILLIILISSCKNENIIPLELKKGLVEFYVQPNKIEEYFNDSSGGKTLKFGDLWINANKININSNLDTIIADVNIFVKKKLNYDGGYEFSKDTLYLYAKVLDCTTSKDDTILGTLHYKILKEGREYKEVEFKELK